MLGLRGFGLSKVALRNAGDVVTEEWCLLLSFLKTEFVVCLGCAVFIWLFGLANVVIWLGCSWKFLGDRYAVSLLELNWYVVQCVYRGK